MPPPPSPEGRALPPKGEGRWRAPEGARLPGHFRTPASKGAVLWFAYGWWIRGAAAWAPGSHNTRRPHVSASTIRKPQHDATSHDWCAEGQGSDVSICAAVAKTWYAARVARPGNQNIRRPPRTAHQALATAAQIETTNSMHMQPRSDPEGKGGVPVACVWMAGPGATARAEKATTHVARQPRPSTRTPQARRRKPLLDRAGCEL